ncbi:tripartite tricarboxylate transporter TctB family protein [Paucibacter sp. APW11]|uniref:Tripartite tricarboxylate transporter TctB family protein n=1 Tax=Roseateles aquae TaxID=3077235 RepID=A0ABU3PE47_9BURK|nr:tripartite tricarboxylate transporter TctB family protein [Paucibacter sp. APW11]MDT9000388.1 tripartite tricarboxylate transporter TctB family protein [Paucibacter sp. APW11]
MQNQEEQAGLPLRWVELLLALLLVAGALLLISDSLRLGIGWADDGPRSGYFPFRIGIGLAVCSAWVAVQQLLAWRRTRTLFAEHGQLRDVAAVLLPTAVYVCLIPWLGIYLPSALLIAWFMWRNRGYRWWSVASVSVGVSMLVFIVFERWFTQPLPKGPIEHWLGF